MYPGYSCSNPPLSSDQRQVIWISTSFGSIESWFYPCPAHRKEYPSPVVIFAHGNREVIEDWPEALNRFLSLGISLYLVEFPGYGRSPGPTTQNTITESMLSAYDTIIQQENIAPDQVILFGRSLGGGAVCSLAEQRKSAALILMSTFTSIRPYARKFIFPDFLLRDTWDNLNIIRKYQQPVLIIHGTYDSIVPYKEGLTLYNKASNSFMLTIDCGHNECPKKWEPFWKEITSFLTNIGIVDKRKIL